MFPRILLGAAASATVAATLMATLTQPPTANVERGREVFQTCATCHGEDGQGRHVGDARFPSIAGLSAWYVQNQLTKFQGGERGGHADDKQGLMMRGMARSLDGPEQIAAVAAFVETLKPKPSESLPGGNAQRGQVIYASVCFACHGDKMQGNPLEAMRAPSPRPLEFWYMQEQLHKFKAGVRGSHPKDLDGAKMAPVVRSVLPVIAEQNGVSTDEAIQDVLTYIYLNREK